MKNRKIGLIFVLMVMIILLTIIMLKGLEKELAPLKEEVQSSREISFGDECNEDLDCKGSFRVCKDGTNVSCENGCVYGVCTSCMSTCPGESQCGNVTCFDSVRTCSDGRIARCTNHCTLENGECSSCVPQCEIDVEDGVNFGFAGSGFALDAIPCMNISYGQRTEIEAVQKDLARITIPEGYSIIVNPFSVNCNGELDLTLNIPEIYTDVTALRCKGQDCNQIVTRHVTELSCGDSTPTELFKKEEYLEPKFMPIEIKEVSGTLASEGEIVSDKFVVTFIGNSNSLGVTLTMPTSRVEEPKNPNLKIVGTPLNVKIEGTVGAGVGIEITMPYVRLEAFEEDSVGIYIKLNGKWKYVGGKIDKDGKTVTAILDNVSNYLNDYNSLEFAIMEILCVSCYGSSLTNVYKPAGGSKDAIILLHGFAPKPNTFQTLIDDIKLTNQPFELWTFDYPSSKTIAETSKEFVYLMGQNHEGYENIHIIAHSLGGLVIQDALYDSYLENKQALENSLPVKNKFLEKIRKLILIATPNEGSPLLEVYKNVFDNFINDKDRALFNPNSPVMEDLTKGVVTPKVPGIDYYIIAGTNPYGFNLLFFQVSTDLLVEKYEKNDGVITVKSAQRIGDEYIDNQCENYWELNLTHTDLHEHPLARRVIGRIISEGTSYENGAIFGHNKYFDLSLNDCSSDDSYVIIGKEIKQEEVFDETGCSCGNGYCGEDENEINCPSDCAIFHLSQPENKFYLLIIISVLCCIISIKFATFRKSHFPHIKKLKDHIKVYYEIIPGEGYTTEELREEFVRKGWPKWVVNNSFKQLRKEFQESYHKPLRDHVRKHLKNGYTEEEIKKVLIRSGWPIEVLDKVFKGEFLEPGYKFKKRYDFLTGGKSYFGIVK